MTRIGRPGPDEAASYYFHYIDQTSGDDPIRLIRDQLDESISLLSQISEEKSLFRYAPDKWSIRQLLNHVTDTERAFAFRVLWFARGFTPPLPGYDQDVAAAGASADLVNWKEHIQEFRAVRMSTIALLQNLSADAWSRTGVASNNRFTVRALAYVIAGHVTHHLTILATRYSPV